MRPRALSSFTTGEAGEMVFQEHTHTPRAKERNVLSESLTYAVPPFTFYLFDLRPKCKQSK